MGGQAGDIGAGNIDPHIGKLAPKIAQDRQGEVLEQRGRHVHTKHPGAAPALLNLIEGLLNAVKRLCHGGEQGRAGLR